MSVPDWIGRKLSNRYLIEEMLGQGGMSAVYKASDPNLKRVVAIKMIHSHLSNDPDFVRRFEQEATAVAKLRHPGIFQVYDFNQDNGVYYMVLEFVPGETFQDLLKRLNADGRRLPVTKATEYMADICEAVDYAHQRGMIHRDIKPANLMLNVAGQAILMDFGIAKILGGQQHTATGAVVGTAMYMSPEQIRGERPDRRTDIYSLGVTLFEMVSGRPPFQADSAITLMMMHINDPVPDPKKLNPDLPDDLTAVINKALAKDPNDRFQTAAEMAYALREALRRITSGAPEATMVEELPRPNNSAAQPISASMTPGAQAQPEKAGFSMLVIVGVFVGLACLTFGGLFLVNRLRRESPALLPEQPVIAVLENTESPTFTLAPQLIATSAETPTLASKATITNTFTATIPPGIPFVRINTITTNDQNHYIVEYETLEFTEIFPGMHIHFFFNTVPPENAGSPGPGPWIMHAGPRPFTGYPVSDRPAGATQMCALVANPNHAVQPGSGNCLDLPKPGEASLPYFRAEANMLCREGPGTSHVDRWQLMAGETVRVLARWYEDPHWLLVDINVPATDTRTDCCWVGSKGALNVPIDQIKVIDFLPDRLDCSSVR